jgi:hypothetical protein
MRRKTSKGSDTGVCFSGGVVEEGLVRYQGRMTKPTFARLALHILTQLPRGMMGDWRLIRKREGSKSLTALA